MSISDLGNVISKITPLLGSVVTESNPIAGLIIMAIAKMFGSTSNPDDLISAIKNDPDNVVKLKSIELEHQEALLQHQVEDRISARDREEKIIQLTGHRDHLLDFISILVIISFFCMCFLNYFIKLEDDRIIMMLIGQMSSGFMMVLAYYFGSTNK